MIELNKSGILNNNVKEVCPRISKTKKNIINP